MEFLLTYIKTGSEFHHRSWQCALLTVHIDKKQGISFSQILLIQYYTDCSYARFLAAHNKKKQLFPKNLINIKPENQRNEYLLRALLARFLMSDVCPFVCQIISTCSEITTDSPKLLKNFIAQSYMLSLILLVLQGHQQSGLTIKGKIVVADRDDRKIPSLSLKITSKFPLNNRFLKTMLPGPQVSQYPD